MQPVQKRWVGEGGGVGKRETKEIGEEAVCEEVKSFRPANRQENKDGTQE